jgi:beta-barrel assembly-enhancing protease
MNIQGTYQDGLSAKPYPCDVVLQDENIYIYLTEENNELIIWSISAFSACHLSGNTLLITYGDYPHQTLQFSGSLVTTVYNQWSGTNVTRRAEGFVFKQKYLAALILCILFLGFCLGSYFYFLPWVGEKSVALVPLDTEIRMGEELSQVFAESNVIQDSASYYANAFAQTLKLNSKYPVHISVIQSKEINAFALPGGKIFIYSGIIEKMHSHEELVALLGHEVTHVVNQHSLKSMFRTAASSLLIAALFGDISGISAGVLTQANEFKQLSYSRDLETEADNNGFQLMLNNKVNPKGMLNLLQLLKEEGKEMPELMKYLSTHPDTDSRIKNIAANKQLNQTFTQNQTLESLYKNLRRCVLDGK